MKVIYIASPYTHEDYDVMEERYQKAVDACRRVIEMGHCPISPIVQSHPVAVKHKMGLSFDFWEEIDFKLIERCDELWILYIDGVNTSEGVVREKEYADRIYKPVRVLIDPNYHKDNKSSEFLTSIKDEIILK